jgi:hypothetical protein
MTEEPTPLAQRLVHQAVTVLYSGVYGPATRARSEAVVVAVLRELINQVRSEAAISGTAGYDEGWDDAYNQIASDFEALADSIEKGGGDD